MYSLKKWLSNCSSFTNSNIWRLTQMGLWMQDQTEVRFDKGGGKRFQNWLKNIRGTFEVATITQPCKLTIQIKNKIIFEKPEQKPTQKTDYFLRSYFISQIVIIFNRDPSKQQLLYCRFIGTSVFNSIIKYNAKVIVRKYRKLLSWIVQDLPLWKDAQPKWRWDHQHK